MRFLENSAVLPLILSISAASLPSDAVDHPPSLLARHASGCSDSATWQNGAGSNTARLCDNGTGLSILDTSSLVNKTDCQALAQKLSSKAGTGHWDMQWDCDGNSPDTLDSSGACSFIVDNVTASNETTITPVDVIGFINQAMDMFPGNDTMFAVTGNTNCNNNNGQTINWRVGPGGSSSGAGLIRPRWVALVVLVGAWVSFQRAF